MAVNTSEINSSSDNGNININPNGLGKVILSDLTGSGEQPVGVDNSGAIKPFDADNLAILPSATQDSDIVVVQRGGSKYQASANLFGGGGGGGVSPLDDIIWTPRQEGPNSSSRFVDCEGKYGFVSGSWTLESKVLECTGAGLFSVNGLDYSAGPTAVDVGDVVSIIFDEAKVNLANDGDAVKATLRSVDGGYTKNYEMAVKRTDPNFVVPPISEAGANAETTSASGVPSITSPTTLSLSAQDFNALTNPMVSINSGAYQPLTSVAVELSPCDSLQFKGTTGPNANDTYTLVFEIGGQAIRWSVTVIQGVSPAVLQPSIISPANAVVGVGSYNDGLDLQSSAYVNVNTAGAHAETDWETYEYEGTSTLREITTDPTLNVQGEQLTLTGDKDLVNFDSGDSIRQTYSPLTSPIIQIGNVDKIDVEVLTTSGSTFDVSKFPDESILKILVIGDGAAGREGGGSSNGDPSGGGGNGGDAGDVYYRSITVADYIAAYGNDITFDGTNNFGGETVINGGDGGPATGYRGQGQSGTEASPTSALETLAADYPGILFSFGAAGSGGASRTGGGGGSGGGGGVVLQTDNANAPDPDGISSIEPSPSGGEGSRFSDSGYGGSGGTGWGAGGGGGGGRRAGIIPGGAGAPGLAIIYVDFVNTSLSLTSNKDLATLRPRDTLFQAPTALNSTNTVSNVSINPVPGGWFTQQVPGGVFSLSCVAYGQNGQWVAMTDAVGGEGAWSNDNGVNWSNINGLKSNFQDVVYGNGVWVAVANGNIDGGARIWYTEDRNPEVWTSTGLIANTYSFNAVAHNGSSFAAVGDNGRILYSEDGKNWTTAGSPVSGDFYAITVGPDNDFLALTSGGAIARSEDNGQTWTERAQLGLTTWGSIAYGGGKYVAISTSGIDRAYIAYSEDGIIWDTSSYQMPTGGGVWKSVVYGEGKFVAVRSGGQSADGSASSIDGKSWLTSATGLNDAPHWDVGYGNGRFVTVRNYSSGTGGAAISWSDTGADSYNQIVLSILGAQDNGFTAGMALTSNPPGGSGSIVEVNNTQVKISQDGTGWTIGQQLIGPFVSASGVVSSVNLSSSSVSFSSTSGTWAVGATAYSFERTVTGTVASTNLASLQLTASNSSGAWAIGRPIIGPVKDVFPSAPSTNPPSSEYRLVDRVYGSTTAPLDIRTLDISPAGTVQSTNQITSVSTEPGTSTLAQFSVLPNAGIIRVNPNGQYLALNVGTDGSSTNSNIWYSNDGLNWVRSNFTAGFQKRVYDAAWSPKLGMWCVAGYNVVHYSTDGIGWQDNYIAGDYRAICWSEEKEMFVMTGAPNYFAYSTNGTTWSAGSNNFGPGLQAHYTSVIYAPKLGLFYATASQFHLSNGYKAAQSTDGINWSPASHPSTSEFFKSVTWNDDAQQAVVTINSTSRHYSVSTDLQTWTDAKTIPGLYPLGISGQVVWSDEAGEYVATGQDHKVYKTSDPSDASSWAGTDLPAASPQPAWYQAAYYKGKWSVIGSFSNTAYIATGTFGTNTVLDIIGADVDGFKIGDQVDDCGDGADFARIQEVSSTQVVLAGEPAGYTSGDYLCRQSGLLSNKVYFSRVKYRSNDPVESLWSNWSGYKTGSLLPDAGGG